jgi:(5-formylfuran-3-yl)methyl phosphate synthase
MRLLVSVRSAAEAAAALRGGADIIDAKEPRRGALGPVTAPVLRQIAEQVPAELPLSVALGEVASVAEVRGILSELELQARPGGTFLKLGFAAGSSPEQIGQLLAVAVKLAASLRCSPRLVAVAFADHTRARLPAPDILSDIVIENGAWGLLLDTAIKDGTGLTGWMAPADLTSWVRRGRRAGVLTAIAGSLSLSSLPEAVGAGPDVIGVRGAACSGGRNGMVEPDQVRALVEFLAAHRLAKRHDALEILPVTEASTQ